MDLKVQHDEIHAQAGKEDLVEKERQWVDQAKQNLSFFAPLYNAYYEIIFRFIYRRVESMDEAGDITAQVFLKAMLSLKKYESRGLPFSSWLYRIAINELNISYREGKAHPCISLQPGSFESLGEEVDANSTDERHDKMIEALGMLSADEVSFIQMRFFERLAFKEIGEILDISENNAKVKTYRILDKLKKLILTR